MLRIKLGDSGPDVKRLQHLLNTVMALTPKLSIDGDFGPTTDAAVRTFQTQRGLTSDGIVGPFTWSLLDQWVKPGLPVVSEPLGSGPPWMTIAWAELGVAEHMAKGKHNTRIVQYHGTTTLKATTDETPWCASFVNWVLEQASYTGTRSAAAKSWLKWGTALEEARYGAITVIKSMKASGNYATGSASGYHVGFLLNETPTHLKLLGGNQGDMVKVSQFPLTKYTLEGYRWA